MDDLQARGDALARDLPTSSVWLDAGAAAVGVGVGAYLANTGELVVFHNLGSAKVPTRREVLELLDVLGAHVAALRSASTAFDTLAAAKVVEIEVVVWSGPMDMTLGRKAGDVVTVEEWLGG